MYLAVHLCLLSVAVDYLGVRVNGNSLCVEKLCYGNELVALFFKCRDYLIKGCNCLNVSVHIVK